MESAVAKVGDTVVAKHNVGHSHDKTLHLKKDERATVVAVRTDSGGQLILFGKQGRWHHSHFNIVQPVLKQIAETTGKSEMETADQRNKADAGKTHPLLLQKDCAPALYLIQRVLDYGLEKYDHKSWHKVPDESWDDAQRRHQQKIDLGEQFDDESGLPHRAHQIAGLILLFSHELGLDVTFEDILAAGRFNAPPQDHKAEAPPTYKPAHQYRPYVYGAVNITGIRKFDVINKDGTEFIGIKNVDWFSDDQWGPHSG